MLVFVCMRSDDDTGDIGDGEEYCVDDDNDAGMLVILGRQLELSALRRAGFYQR